ncbi:MAG: DUF1007 family protein [Pseudomonadota bacterium]
MKPSQPQTCAALVVASLVTTAAFATPATAHPHVWVNVQTTVAYDVGKLKGITHRWTFDDMYTAMAIQGLDKNGDGKYDREELKELAQVNIDGLKEFDYFTYAKLGDQDLNLDQPIDYWLEHTGGILSLHFTLPLAEPVLAEAEGFNYQVYDPSYFIAFDLAEKDPVKLGAGAPEGCTADISVPQSDMQQAQDLSDAFLSQFGGDFGVTLAKTIAVKCART